MKLLKISVVVGLIFIAGCSEQPPTGWMLAERNVIQATCTQNGMIVPRKYSTASETITWSCTYPDNYDKWLIEFDTNFTARGWYLVQESNVDWQTYCHKEKYVHLRLGKVKDQDSPKPKLWISLRYPAAICPKPVEPEKSK